MEKIKIGLTREQRRRLEVEMKTERMMERTDGSWDAFVDCHVEIAVHLGIGSIGRPKPGRFKAPVGCPPPPRSLSAGRRASKEGQRTGLGSRGCLLFYPD